MTPTNNDTINEDNTKERQNKRGLLEKSIIQEIVANKRSSSLIIGSKNIF